MSADPNVLAHVHELIPSKDVAQALVRTYCERNIRCEIIKKVQTLMEKDCNAVTRVEWMYCPSDRPSIETNLALIFSAPSLHLGTHRIAPHRLATILLVFALGHIFSDGQLTNINHRQLFSTASALLTIPKHHFMIRHTLAAVECLHMMVTYLFSTGRPDAAKAGLYLGHV